MIDKIPTHVTAELLRLEKEISDHEKSIEWKNERRREIINRYSLNKGDKS
ncbi:hypothetical protein [Dickeya poaceiphila]|nr:hypothetical protein [Dickeya poaceiphila]